MAETKMKVEHLKTLELLDDIKTTYKFLKLGGLTYTKLTCPDQVRNQPSFYINKDKDLQKIIKELFNELVVITGELKELATWHRDWILKVETCEKL